jgi:hypothetical protein
MSCVRFVFSAKTAVLLNEPQSAFDGRPGSSFHFVCYAVQGVNYESDRCRSTSLAASDFPFSPRQASTEA